MNSDFALGPDETQQVTTEDLAFRITGLIHKCQLSMRGVQKFACTNPKLPKGVRRVAINRYFLKPLFLSLKAEIVVGNKIPMAKLQAKYHEHGVIDEFQTAVKCLRQLSRFEKDHINAAALHPKIRVENATCVLAIIQPALIAGLYNLCLVLSDLP